MWKSTVYITYIHSLKKKSEINVHVPIAQLKNITATFEDPYVPFSKSSSPEG